MQFKSYEPFYLLGWLNKCSAKPFGRFVYPYLDNIRMYAYANFDPNILYGQ